MLQEIQLIPGQTNCVLVSTGYPPNGVVKTTIDKRALPIAPAPDTYSHGSTSELMMCRKKINFKSNPYSGPQAVSIARRNARERNRVKQVNDGFSALRRHLPPAVVAALSNGARRGAGKKLSKVDTLRMVVEYIRYLQQLLDESAESKVTYENEENVAYTAPAEHTFMYETSPCSEQAPSPSPSDSSSGVSSGYSFNTGYSTEHYEPQAPVHQDISPMDEDELLDVISWWQQK